MTASIPITEVTRSAAIDSLTDDDYRDIYDELRLQHSLRQFVEITSTQYSIAWWSKFERHDADLTRPAKNDLRRAVGLPALPPTVQEATAGVDPNAVVYQVGEDRPNRVILIGHHHPLRMTLNGILDVSEENAEAPPGSHVTGVTRRPPRRSVSLRPELWQSLNEARVAAGASWEEFLQPLLAQPVQPAPRRCAGRVVGPHGMIGRCGQGVEDGEDLCPT